jgi:ABC-type phosphate/phosphonate transport system substrate-binding protein
MEFIFKRGACAINAIKSPRLLQLTALTLIGIALTACGGRGGVQATLPPNQTPTPRATLLPTVATQVPYGGANKPYQMIVLPPEGSTASPQALASFLKDRTTLNFNVTLAASDSDVLAALCGPVPTLAWVDGWVLLAAQAQGCGNVSLRIKEADATGLKSDIMISVSAPIDNLPNLRGRSKSRDYCRLSSNDAISWILPVAVLRTPGFDPLLAFRSIKDYGDIATMVQDTSDNKCVAAIASGTLTSYKALNVQDITKVIKIIGTTPELPFGGLMASSAVPRNVADAVSNVFPDHVDALSGMVTADSLVPATNDDYADTQKAFQAAGFNFATLGQ